MKQFDTLAVCLKNTPLREHDHVAVFYSADKGMLSAVVKGAKKPTSKLAGVCSPLTMNHVYFREGKNLHTVMQYQREASFENIRENMERLAIGTVFADVLHCLGQAEDADSEAMFQELMQALEALNTLEIPWVETSITYHRAMLSLAGYFPHLIHVFNARPLWYLMRRFYTIPFRFKWVAFHALPAPEAKPLTYQQTPCN